MGDLVLKKTTTGQITLTPQDVAGNQTVTIPASTGTLSIANTSTSGGIFFGGASSGVLYQDASNLYWDDTNNRLGVGTASPTAPLNVKSSSDGAVIGLVAGASYAVRLGTTAAVGAVIEGVDVTGSASYQPLIVGGTQVSFTTSGTERARINTSGNLQFITADAGIVFNKSGALTNSTLDDYEEGSWTPTITPLSGSLTSYVSSGTYTRIGNTVSARFAFSITNAGTAGSVAIVSNLPYPTTGGNTTAGVMRENAVIGICGALVPPSTTQFYGAKYDGGTPFVTNYTWVCEVTYQTS